MLCILEADIVDIGGYRDKLCCCLSGNILATQTKFKDREGGRTVESGRVRIAERKGLPLTV